MENEDQLPLIVGLGEVLWDIFPDGARFGGAPANFACAVAALARDQARSAMVSSVGTDALGNEAIETLQSRGVSTAGVVQQARPTGQVLIQLDELGRATYEFAADTAWDHLAWTDAIGQLSKRASVVCFGSLGQRSQTSRQVIRRFLEQAPESCLRLFDINLRDPFWNEQVILESLDVANVLKCNEEELPVIARLLGLKGDKTSLLRQLLQQFDLRMVVFTEGAEGSTLVDCNGSVSRHPAEAAEVVDTVGAGDSLTAAIALGLLHRYELDQLHPWASRVAGYVCSQPGATPPIPEALRQP